jgi:hypothetical protein
MATSKRSPHERWSLDGNLEFLFLNTPMPERPAPHRPLLWASDDLKADSSQSEKAGKP